MSLFDSVMKAATGAAPALDASQSSLASAALSMLSHSQSGGISGLYRRLWATAVAPHQNQSHLFPLLPHGSDRPSRRPPLAVC